MATPFKICIYVAREHELDAQRDLTLAFAKIREMDGWMSEWRPQTVLSQINQSAGLKPVRVNRELFGLLAFALEVSRASQGAFDPTFNALWGVYNFKPGSYREPSEQELKERLPLLDYRKVQLDEKAQTVFLAISGMRLGLGGLGQGYAVDQIADWLRGRGYPAGLVDGSGDTFFWGKKPDGALWKIGVRDPRYPERVVGHIYGTDFAVTTCGDDNKFFMVGRRRVHHVIDPHTGRPAQGVRQVTVIAPRALQADAYDTAAFVLGAKKGRRLLERQGLSGIFVTDKEVLPTARLKREATRWGEVWQVPKW